jgi:hypothetical protein
LPVLIGGAVPDTLRVYLQGKTIGFTIIAVKPGHSFIPCAVPPRLAVGKAPALYVSYCPVNYGGH